MPTLALNTLPPEIHLKISSHLERNECTILSLMCKHLKAIYALSPVDVSPTNMFTMMFEIDDSYTQKKLLEEWTARLLLLPLLFDWIERAMREARL